MQSQYAEVVKEECSFNEVFVTEFCVECSIISFDCPIAYDEMIAATAWEVFREAIAKRLVFEQVGVEFFDSDRTISWLQSRPKQS